MTDARVLVAEDDSDVRELVCTILRRAGHATSEAREAPWPHRVKLRLHAPAQKRGRGAEVGGAGAIGQGLHRQAGGLTIFADAIGIDFGHV